MCRTSLMILVLVAATPDLARAQLATSIALKVMIKDPIREARYGMTQIECSHFEVSLANSICQELHRRYWQWYCWELLPIDKAAITPDGDILIELFATPNTDNWHVRITGTRMAKPGHQFNFGPFPLFDPKTEITYFNNHSGCSQKELPDRLLECLRKQFFSNDAGSRLIDQLKPIPVGRGIVSSNNPPIPIGHGAVLLSWERYEQFRHAVFRFEAETQAGDLWQWRAKALRRLPWNNDEVFDVQYQEPLAPMLKERGLVFLEKVNAERDPFVVTPQTVVPLTEK
jgi:hypothetical protein